MTLEQNRATSNYIYIYAYTMTVCVYDICVCVCVPICIYVTVYLYMHGACMYFTLAIKPGFPGLRGVSKTSV